jgi:hypothetical protein
MATKTRIDTVQDKLQSHLIESGLHTECIVECDSSAIERRYYIRTNYSISGVVERNTRDGGGFRVLLEYTTDNEMADNCGILEQQFSTIQDMLSALKFHLSIFRSLRKSLANVL